MAVSFNSIAHTISGTAKNCVKIKLNILRFDGKDVWSIKYINDEVMNCHICQLKLNKGLKVCDLTLLIFLIIIVFLFCSFVCFILHFYNSSESTQEYQTTPWTYKQYILNTASNFYFRLVIERKLFITHTSVTDR